MANPINPFTQEGVKDGVVQGLASIVASMTLEEDAVAVLAATEIDSDVSLVDSDLVLATFATPRALTLTPSDLLMAGTIVVTGLDEDGAVASENFVYDSDVRVNGVQLFSSLTSVVFSGVVTDSDDTVTIGWDIPSVVSLPLKIPNGSANLQFALQSSEVSAAGVLGVRWDVSWDNITYFEWITAPFAETTVIEADQPELILYGPGKITAPYVKMTITANDDIDATDKFTVAAWVAARTF